MTPQEARGNAEKTNSLNQEAELSQFDKDLNELYQSALRSIERNSKDGDLDCLFCIDYKRKDVVSFRENSKLADGLAYKLQCDGFRTGNYGVFGHPLGVSIDWRKK